MSDVIVEVLDLVATVMSLSFAAFLTAVIVWSGWRVTVELLHAPHCECRNEPMIPDRPRHVRIVDPETDR